MPSKVIKEILQGILLSNPIFDNLEKDVEVVMYEPSPLSLSTNQRNSQLQNPQASRSLSHLYQGRTRTSMDNLDGTLACRQHELDLSPKCEFACYLKPIPQKSLMFPFLCVICSALHSPVSTQCLRTGPPPDKRL